MPDPIDKMGDTVKLRSGGPELTVVWIEKGTEGSTFVRVVWIDSSGAPQAQEYPIEALVLVSPIAKNLPQVPE